MGILNFTKYQATGNDFIMIDDRQQVFNIQNTGQIGNLCHRRFGVGADGLILLREHPTVDFEMIYFNPDGSQSLCGNGSRCALRFAESLDMIEEKATFKAVDGIHSGHIEGDLVYIKMQDVPGIQVYEDKSFYVDTGSPHYISLVSDLEDLDVVSEGRSIRYQDRFSPGGTNVNFVKEQSGLCKVRTYERGVEAETYSCGTGVTAVALVMATLGMASPVKLDTQGGELEVSFHQNENGSFQDIYLIGPACEVFQGAVHLQDSTIDAPI